MEENATSYVTSEQAKRWEINSAFEHLLGAIHLECLPPSRELSLVMTKIEEAQLWFSKTKVE